MKLLQKRVQFALFLASIVTASICLSYFFHAVMNWYSPSDLAIKPRSFEHIYGVFTIVLVHGSLEHLFFNIIPLFVLITFLVFFYLRVSLQVLFFIVLVGGLGVFFWAEGGRHVGASGLVFGLIAFLISSGFIRMNRGLIVVSLLVVFLYGGTLWGIVPSDPQVSWEGHLFGALAGLISAIIWRNKGPRRNIKKLSLKKEDEEDEYEIFSS